MPAFVTSIAPRARLHQSSAWAGLSLHSRPRSLFTPGLRIRPALPSPPECSGSSARRTAPAAMLGGGGFLGVGPAEIVVIVAVGWLLLGPEKLYALARDSGKILGQLRSYTDEARSTFKDALDLEMIEAELDAKTKKTDKPSADTAAASPSTAAADVDDGGIADILREDAPVAAPEADEPRMEPLAKSGPAAAEPAANTAFLDQLRRVADTEQVAPSEAGAPVDAAEQNAGFLEQLRRVGDRGQTAPAETAVSSDIPQEVSMDGATEEELEIERLERQYIEARRKLEERRRRTGGSDGAES